MATDARIMELAREIRLVPATPDHATLLDAIFNGANTRQYSPVGKASVGELARRLAHSGTALSERAPFYRVFGERDSILFGTFIIKNIDWDGRQAEVGFSLLDQWQGQGLGSALVYKCVETIFQSPELDTLWATVSVTNLPCQKVLRRTGFHECGPYDQQFRILGKLVPQLLYRQCRSGGSAGA